MGVQPDLQRAYSLFTLAGRTFDVSQQPTQISSQINRRLGGETAHVTGIRDEPSSLGSKQEACVENKFYSGVPPSGEKE
jgi:hypothetical protein